MADFEPAAVARQVPALAKLLEARQQLANLMRYMDGKVAAEETLRKLLADPQLMIALKNRAAESGNESERSASSQTNRQPESVDMATETTASPCHRSAGRDAETPMSLPHC